MTIQVIPPQALPVKNSAEQKIVPVAPVGSNNEEYGKKKIEGITKLSRHTTFSPVKNTGKNS